MHNKVNPFNPNSVVAPNLFAGRANQVHQVVKKLAQVREKRLPILYFMESEE